MTRAPQVAGDELGRRAQVLHQSRLVQRATQLALMRADDAGRGSGDNEADRRADEELDHRLPA